MTTVSAQELVEMYKKLLKEHKELKQSLQDLLIQNEDLNETVSNQSNVINKNNFHQYSTRNNVDVYSELKRENEAIKQELRNKEIVIKKNEEIIFKQNDYIKQLREQMEQELRNKENVIEQLKATISVQEKTIIESNNTIKKTIRSRERVIRNIRKTRFNKKSPSYYSDNVNNDGVVYNDTNDYEYSNDGKRMCFINYNTGHVVYHGDELFHVLKQKMLGG